MEYSWLGKTPTPELHPAKEKGKKKKDERMEKRMKPMMFLNWSSTQTDVNNMLKISCRQMDVKNQ